MIEHVRRCRLRQRGEFLRRIHSAKFPVGVVRNRRGPLLHRLRLCQQFGLVVFGQTVMGPAHVNPGVNPADLAKSMAAIIAAAGGGGKA